MPKINVVIVGGGFAGLRVARQLRRYQNRFNVRLVTDSTVFRYSPALYRSATGFRKRESIIPIRHITKGYKNLSLIHARVKSINRTKKTLTTDEGKVIHYDICILSMGVVTSYFGIPGLEENSFSIKTPEGLDKLKNHLHQTLTDDQRPDANYVVVGGGPTGVELSAALASYLRKIIKKHKTKKRAVNIELIEAAPKVLQIMHPKVSKVTAKHLRKLKIKLLLGEAVKGETSDSITISNRSIPSKTVIWTAGVTNNPFYKQNPEQFNLNERGKVVVDDYMMIDENTYVLGDNAATPYGGLAQVAIRDATYAASSILRISRGQKLRKYNQKRPIYIVPAGKSWSVMQYKNFVYSGKLVAVLRSIADLYGYAEVMGMRKAFGIWRGQNTSEETCRVCKVAKID